MALTYTNFRGDMYYLHIRKTKKGNDTYYFSKKGKGNLVDKLPDGYEIYEEPNGKVYLRKQLKRLFTDEEINVIKDGMDQHCPIQDFKLDIKKEFIYIYTVSNSLEDSPFEQSLFTDEQKYKNYETVMRFQLIDSGERRFEVQRYNFLGSIDDWIELGDSTNLQSLVAEYVSHIGKESFYELI